MLMIVGSVMVLVCVFGGYMAMGGKLGALWQPFELVIIGGAALGAFVIANPMTVIKKAAAAMGDLMKGGEPYTKAHYLELLSLLYTVFKMAKSKGMLALEQHVESRTRARSGRNSRTSRATITSSPSSATICVSLPWAAITRTRWNR